MSEKQMADLSGHTGEDPSAAAAAQVLKGIKSELIAKIEGIQAEVSVYKDANILEQLSELKKLSGIVEGLQAQGERIPADLKDELESMKSKLKGVQAQLMSPAASGKAEMPKTLGERIFEDEGFQAMISTSTGNIRAAKFSLSGENSIGSIQEILSGVSAVPILGDADLGPLRWSTRQTDVVMENKEPVAGFVPEIGVIPAPGFQVYEWQKETLDSYTGYVRTTLAVALTGFSVAPVGVAEVNDASHFVPGTNVRFFDAARNLLGTLELLSVDTVTVPNQLLFTGTPIDWDQDADTNITSEQWLGTAEEADKPFTLLAGEQTSVNAVTIAIMAAVTRQQLLSPSGIEAWIRQELPNRTLRNIAYQLLYGTGTGGELLGFDNYPTAQTYLWSSGTVGDNRIDAILRAVLLVVGGSPSIVMNKRDLQTMRLLKDDQENYLRSNILGMVRLDMMGGQWVLDGQYPIIVSDAVKDGDFFIVDFAVASKLIDAEDEALEWGVINDDFRKNIRRARYERTMAHAIQRRLAFVNGTWDSAPV